MKDGFVLRLACEEIVMNVTSYAYPDDVEGFIDIEIEKTDHRIMIRFKDGGAPFNPLERPRPDTKCPLCLRKQQQYINHREKHLIRPSCG